MKTLIIAEKPSVGRDIAGALDGVFQKRTLADLNQKKKKAKDATTLLESDDYRIRWAADAADLANQGAVADLL